MKVSVYFGIPSYQSAIGSVCIHEWGVSNRSGKLTYLKMGTTNLLNLIY